MSSKNPERLIFDLDRQQRMTAHDRGEHSLGFVRDERGWILFGPYDIRGQASSFMFCLQKLPKQKLPRVRVGCRYYTLAEAYKHWSRKTKCGYFTHSKNEGRQALAIIRLLLLQAQAYHLISAYTTIKFDSTILKPKRK